MPELTALGFRVLSYDLYGRGYSDRPRGPQSHEFFVQQLSDLLDALDVNQPITLIGNSMGSAISAAFAAKHPTKVRQAILFVPAGMGHDLGAVANFTRHAPGIGSWLMHVFYGGKLKKGAEAEQGLPSTVPQIGARQVEELQYKGFLRSVHASLRGALGASAEAAHRDVAAQGVPVLAVWGETDTIIPIDRKPVLEAWNTKAVHVVLPKTGHGLVYTHTDALIAAITPHLMKG